MIWLSCFLFIVLCFHSATQFIFQKNTDESNVQTSFLQELKSDKEKQSTSESVKQINHESSRSKRETRLVELLVNGKTIRFTLVPLRYNALPPYTPVWTAIPSPSSYHTLNNGPQYEKLDFMDTYLDGEFYENFNDKTIMYVTQKNEQADYFGVHKEGNQMKVIQTLPKKLQFSKITKYSDDVFFTGKMFLDSYVILPNDDDSALDYSILNNFTKVREPYNVLYPKLLIVVDYNYYEQFNGNIKDIMQYLSVFWNLVQLKFREIEYPKVEIMIKGIIITKNPITLNKILVKEHQDQTKVNLTNFFRQGKNLFNKTFSQNMKFRNFDAVIIMTNYTGFYGDSSTALGLAVFGHVCYKLPTFISDKANFDGIITAVHELGHLLGMEHDKTISTKWYGTIMSANKLPAESFYWTKYNVESLKIFASTKESWCLNETFLN